MKSTTDSNRSSIATVKRIGTGLAFILFPLMFAFAFAVHPGLLHPRLHYRPLTEVEMELARTKKELAIVKMERDILKKAAAYFAKESLPGTR
jgi:hypothetical protein